MPRSEMPSSGVVTQLVPFEIATRTQCHRYHPGDRQWWFLPGLDTG